MKNSKSVEDNFGFFCELMEENFGGEEKQINVNSVDEFKTKLFSHDISKEDKSDIELDVKLDIGNYYYQFIMSSYGNFSIRHKTHPQWPLYSNNEYILQINSQIFMDLFNELIPINESYRDMKINVVTRLCGLLDDPVYLRLPLPPHPLDRYADNDEPILLLGETGTGKELYAKSLHYLSPRRKEKFLAINCTALSEQLLESELFGHSKGAFTGADADKSGYLEAVGKGTLFLDEVGDMPLTLQAKLLRVLEYGDYYKVGDPNNPLMFNGRIIAATNKNLSDEINNRRFRNDLYYRINVLSIQLTSLREKIQLLKDAGINIQHRMFSAVMGIIMKIDNKQISDPLKYQSDNPIISLEALDALINYRYPGNYREFNNIIKRAYILFSGKIEIEHLPNEVKICHNDTTMQTHEHSVSHDDQNVKLKDIFNYTESVVVDIIEKRIEEIISSGKNIQEVLTSEGVNKNGYTTFMKKIKKIFNKHGRESIRDRRKRYHSTFPISESF